MRRVASCAGLLGLVLGPLAACSDDSDVADPVPSLSGQVFDDPAGDVERTSRYDPPPPEGGVGDVRRVAVDAADGIVSLTVALAGVPAASAAGSRATRFDIRFDGRFTSARSTFEELVIGARVNDRGVASASVSVYNEVQQRNRALCRGRTTYSPSRALVRVEVATSCLPEGRLSVGGPTLEVTTSGPSAAGTDTVDLGVRRLTAP